MTNLTEHAKIVFNYPKKPNSVTFQSMGTKIWYCYITWKVDNVKHFVKGSGTTDEEAQFNARAVYEAGEFTVGNPSDDHPG